MRWSTARTVAAFSFPGGVLLAGVAGAAWLGVLPLAAAPLSEFFFFSVLAAGGLLALRFRSGRALLALAVLLLAGLAMRPAVELSAAGVAALAFLLPVNLAGLGFARERGFRFPGASAVAGLMVAQAAVVLLVGRAEHADTASLFQMQLVPHAWLAWTGLPQAGLLAFAAAAALLVGLFLLHGDAMHSGLAWAALAGMLAARAGAGDSMALVYLGTGGLILAAALVEAGYRLAYDDELTLLPGRRAFNERLLRLQSPYALAVVDVDHFKKFNDLFGHEVGDQVLQMVARRLAQAGGGSQAFRVGGEEFCLVFDGKTALEAADVAEELRASIEDARFTVRAPERRAVRAAAEGGGQERRARGERRRAPRGAGRKALAAAPQRHTTRVTVSIGVAEAGPGWEAEQVVRAADRALYAAKHAGRNCVQIAPAGRAARRRAAAPTQP